MTALALAVMFRRKFHTNFW